MKRIVPVILIMCALALASCSTETSDEGASGGGGETGGKWVKVITLKGQSAKTSAPFKLQGGEQKLDWSVKGGNMVTASVYVEPKGTDLMEEGGFPVVMPDKAGSDSTRLNKDEGEYILIVDSANCSWRVTLYEKR